jgi:hypothetical protein
MEAPDYIGLAAGARTWRLANTTWAKMGGWLWSWSMLECWRKGQEWKEAECTRGHRIPGYKCGCGIWAFFDAKLMADALPPALGRDGRERFEYVGGIVAAGGDIVMHEFGFRAEYAKVLAIFDDNPSAPLAEIAENYGCDIVSSTDYDTYCAKRGLIRLDGDG